MSEHEVENLEKAIQSLKSMQIEMTRDTRSNLVRICARETAASQAGFWAGIRHVFVFQVPPKAMATALGLLVILVGVTSILVSHKAVSYPTQASESPVRLVSLNPDASGGITLQWRDGSQRLYRVLKSDNPRDFSKAVSYRVRGNRWTDLNPGAGQVTFYRVE